MDFNAQCRMRNAQSMRNFKCSRFKEFNVQELNSYERIADAHVCLGFIRLSHDWNWDQSEHEHRLALALDVSNALCRAHHALYLLSVGRLSDAIIETRRAQELDPVSPYIRALVGLTLTFAGHCDEASRNSGTPSRWNPIS